MITFKIIENKEEKMRTSRNVLESLSEWFGIGEGYRFHASQQDYI